MALAMGSHNYSKNMFDQYFELKINYSNHTQCNDAQKSLVEYTFEHNWKSWMTCERTIRIFGNFAIDSNIFYELFMFVIMASIAISLRA